MQLLACYLVIVFTAASNAAPAGDLIKDLPGLSFKPGFKQYSGYLEASKTSRLHYWFVESQSNPRDDPMVVWFTGGPGCSSLYAFLAENGPFSVNNDGRNLEKNPFSWNTQANVIFMESPAQVGFSYSLDPHYTTDDDKTAKENYVALKDFFNKFPEYATNDFYVTGESYAGVYVPTLVSLLLDDPAFKQLKGFAVGNGVTNTSQSDNTAYYFFQFHNMLGTKTWKQLLDVCQCEKTTPFGDYCRFKEQAKTIPKCKDLLLEANNTGVSDPYNVYADCDSIFQRDKLRIPLSTILKDEKAQPAPADYTIGCANTTALTNYLNLPQVRKALHIPKNLPKWQFCGGPPYTQTYFNMKPVYEKALASKRLRILVYNGDFDTVCNFLGCQWFVDDLHQDNPSTRAPWYYKKPSGKVNGGYFKTFPSSNLTFATVRGAGHMVPYDKPEAALAMLSNFLQDKPFGG